MREERGRAAHLWSASTCALVRIMRSPMKKPLPVECRCAFVCREGVSE